MGVIRKKTAGRGSEGGVKYICDVCSVDITSTVSATRSWKRSFVLPCLHAQQYQHERIQQQL